MFGHTKRLYEHGAQAQGQVYALTAYGNPGGMQDYGVKVRVALPDGSVAEFEKGPLRARGIRGLTVGSIVPVRYDPDHPSTVVLDLPALEEKTRESDAAQRSVLDSQFANLGHEPGISGALGGALAGDLKTQIMQLAGQNPNAVLDLRGGGAPDDPVDRLARLADLRDRGVLSETEFAEQKARLLDER